MYIIIALQICFLYGVNMYSISEDVKHNFYNDSICTLYSRCDLRVSLIPLMQTQSHDGETWRWIKVYCRVQSANQTMLLLFLQIFNWDLIWKYTWPAHLQWINICRRCNFHISLMSWCQLRVIREKQGAELKCTADHQPNNASIICANMHLGFYIAWVLKLYTTPTWWWFYDANIYKLHLKNHHLEDIFSPTQCRWKCHYFEHYQKIVL